MGRTTIGQTRLPPRVVGPACMALTLLSACAGIGFPGSTLPAGLAGTAPTPPEVYAHGARLQSAPSDAQVARWLCDQLALPFVCRAFGPAVSDADLRFVFDVELEVQNRAAVPVPLVSALFAFTAFPGATEAEGENLGAVCVALCGSEAEETVPRDCDRERACEVDDDTIRDMGAFATASAGFLLDVARGERRMEDLRVRTLAANDRMTVVFRLEVAAGPLLRILQRVLVDAVGEIRSGRRPPLEIPYRLEGSVFLEVEGFGRFAASMPELDQIWHLGARIAG